MREICFRGFHPSEDGTQEIWTSGTCQGEKHRADVAEEALDLAYEEWTCCDSCMFSVDCKTNRADCKKAEISKIKQQADCKVKEVSNGIFKI